MTLCLYTMIRLYSYNYEWKANGHISMRRDEKVEVLTAFDKVGM